MDPTWPLSSMMKSISTPAMREIPFISIVLVRPRIPVLLLQLFAGFR